jgi:hypothetical protein
MAAVREYPDQAKEGFMFSKRVLVLASLSMFGPLGCETPIGASGGFHVPGTAAADCTQQCAEIGMGLSAVAIMANHVGCVCQAGPSSRSATLGAAPAGMATISMMQARQQQEQQHNFRH